ncbi:SDR family NAD(P)-dependent oxidoreductase [Polyangium mundeleinium]|uniref:SDR family NAD(P)-dependent oxidoreductase n=1 Tax=Polyangium mundeleinium TaxID=2995306 RepID=A0ABT5F1F3_9BACT|nr:SDR family NAD(P)-dependent oxidoreductase [Polyangium mundeleinium]MDC0747273.1 SDR family NAD(P)-dependent oxidoreductase [Polyangium mundeleinium]
MFLAGKNALVTGGGRGIGRAIAERLAREGARVLVTGRTQPEIDEVANEIGGVAVRMDAKDRASVKAAIDTVHAVGPVDVLVNNAGFAESVPFDRTTDEVWDDLLEVNVTSAFALCRAFVPGMIERGFGRVINVASNAGLVGYGYSVAYCASKHAMVGMTRALAVEIAKSPVTVNAVCPGWTRTRMGDEATSRIAQKTGRSAEAAQKILANMSPQQRFAEPEEIAHIVAMLCAPEARSVHGQAIPIDGGQVMK